MTLTEVLDDSSLHGKFDTIEGKEPNEVPYPDDSPIAVTSSRESAGKTPWIHAALYPSYVTIQMYSNVNKPCTIRVWIQVPEGHPIHRFSHGTWIGQLGSQQSMLHGFEPKSMACGLVGLASPIHTL
jgi:hypothetical protein